MSYSERIMLGTWGLVMLGVVFQLYKWHITPGNDFDLRHYVTSPDAKGIERPDLSKLILLMVAIASTYAMMKDATDTTGAQPALMAVYLGAWVLNKAVSTGGRILPQMFGGTSGPFGSSTMDGNKAAKPQEGT